MPEVRTCRNGHVSRRSAVSSGKTGCRACAIERARRWQAKNPDKVRQYKKTNAQRQPEKARERRKRWISNNTEKHREVQRRWASHNKDAHNKTRKLRRRLNPDKTLRERVLYRMARECGVDAKRIPEDLVEAKVAQLKAKFEARRMKREGSC